VLQAVIFDIDGTLIDSVDQHAAAWVETFRHFGLGPAFKDARQQIGKGGDQFLPVFLLRDRLEREGEAIEQFRGELFKRDYLPTVRAWPGVRALFERLRTDGRKCVLGTSSKKDEADRYAKIAGVADLVDAITTSDDAEHSKPCPDIFQAALQKLAPIPAEAAVVIGDTPYDAESAARAGLRTLGVRCGGFSDEDLKAAGCIAIYDGPWELLARYEEWAET
jgi:HAD superfamily hydrolase (TIGR01509 family)